MRLKNKGFSLVELLVAMAAFAIVMVGIISLMRSSSISFRNESMEVDLERDSQLLMAQVEEFIVDCKSIAPDTSDVTATVAYSVTEPDGTSHSIKQIGTNVLLDGEVLADNVEYFFVNGLTQNDGLKDNVCMLDVKLNSKAGGTTGKDFTYKGYKQVYFRNDIDNVIADGLPDLDTVTPGPGPANQKILNMGRYEVVNLKSRFNLATVESWTASGTDGFAFCATGTDVDPEAYLTNGGLNSVYYLPTGSTSLYITTNSTCNGLTNDSFSGTLTGYKANGDGTPSTTLITIVVNVPKVDLELGSGVIECPPNLGGSVNNPSANGGGGFCDYIEYKGFCIRDYNRYFSSDPGYSAVKANLTLKDGGTTKGSMEGEVVSIKNTGFATGFGGQIQLNTSSDGWTRAEQFGIYYDEEYSNYLIIRWLNGDKPSPGYFNSHDMNMDVSVTCPGLTTPVTKSKNYKVRTNGASLSGL